MKKSPKEECEDLMDELVPFAEELLRKHGEFFPFGGTMATDGTSAHAHSYDGREQPPSQDVIDLMSKDFRKSAQEGGIKACAILFDARVVPPGATGKTDAVVVSLDYQDNYSVQVFFPYAIGAGNEIEFGDVFAQAGETAIFTG